MRMNGRPNVLVCSWERALDGYWSWVRHHRLPLENNTDHTGSGTGLVSIALRQYLAKLQASGHVEITATDLGETSLIT